MYFDPLVILLALGFLILIFWPRAKDNTDPAGGRSGLRVYTDDLTGLQYLSVSGGGITPRLDKDGKHICIK